MRAWLIIVSTQMVVLPVERSPMISSRWPRPIGNHRVNRHDAGLHRLADGFAFDDAGRDFFHRIKRRGFLDRALAVERLAEHVDDAAQQTFADGHLQQFAGGADFVAFLDFGVIAENDRADFGLFQVEREAGDAVAEIQHLVEHRVGEAFDLGHAVADFADVPTFCLAVAVLAPAIWASISCNKLLIKFGQKLCSNFSKRVFTLPS
jgi:hypothetical protein